jgi:hypothetical protein
MPKKEKKDLVKEKKLKEKRNSAKEKSKMKVMEEKKSEPVSRVDINTKIYRDLFKFLDEKVSMECFIDLHEQCYGKTNCQCECHKK